MGHALDNTMQDILIRFKRMQGYNALWQPGTDHAAIATEVKVIEALKKEGIEKDDLGREGFLERVWDWRREYGGRIINQLKRLGSSADWDRERFTMDEGNNKAVTERCKLKRDMDAEVYEPKEVLDIDCFDIINYEIRQDKKDGSDNWINLFCGIRKEGKKRLRAFSFHGNMPCIYKWLRLIERSYGDRSFLPIEDARLINHRGYMLDGTFELIEEVDPDEYYAENNL